MFLVFRAVEGLQGGDRGRVARAKADEVREAGQAAGRDMLVEIGGKAVEVLDALGGEQDLQTVLPAKVGGLKNAEISGLSAVCHLVDLIEDHQDGRKTFARAAHLVVLDLLEIVEEEGAADLGAPKIVEEE